MRAVNAAAKIWRCLETTGFESLWQKCERFYSELEILTLGGKIGHSLFCYYPRRVRKVRHAQTCIVRGGTSHGIAVVDKKKIEPAKALLTGWISCNIYLFQNFSRKKKPQKVGNAESNGASCALVLYQRSSSKSKYSIQNLQDTYRVRYEIH